MKDLGADTSKERTRLKFYKLRGHYRRCGTSSKRQQPLKV